MSRCSSLWRARSRFGPAGRAVDHTREITCCTRVHRATRRLACSDSAGPGQGGVFTYTVRGGNFSASGEVAFTTGRVGPRDSCRQARRVGASNPRSGVCRPGDSPARAHAPGSESIDANARSTSCTGMDFYLNFNGNGDNDSSQLTTIVRRYQQPGKAFSGSRNGVDGTGGASEGFR